MPDRNDEFPPPKEPRPLPRLISSESEDELVTEVLPVVTPQSPAAPSQTPAAPSHTAVTPPETRQTASAPEAPATTAFAGTVPPPAAKPIRIEPTLPPEPEKPRRRGAAMLVLLLAVLSCAVAAGLWFFLFHKGSSSDTPEEKVTATVLAFSRAANSGDSASLDELRQLTTGPLHDFYQNMTPEQFADLHKTVPSGKVPDVQRVIRVQVNGNSALAEVNLNLDGEAMVRSVNLQLTDAGWRVTYPPTK